jgi:hypothetical protein
MKLIGLRLASALVAISICFGASARAHVALPGTPITTHTNNAAISPQIIPIIPTTVTFIAAAVVYVAAAVYRATTQASVSHPLEQVDPAAQFDLTK